MPAEQTDYLSGQPPSPSVHVPCPSPSDASHSSLLLLGCSYSASLPILSLSSVCLSLFFLGKDEVCALPAPPQVSCLVSSSMTTAVTLSWGGHQAP